MIGNAPLADRVTQFRLIMFWTILLGVLLTASSDFSFATAPGRFIYWITHIGFGLVVVSLVTRWLQRIWLYRLGEWMQLAISSVIAIVVFAPIGIALDYLLPNSFGPEGHGDIALSMQEDGPVTAALDEIGASAPTVVAVWLIVHLSYRFLNASSREPSANTPADSDVTSVVTDRPKFDGITKKIPHALGNNIVLLRSDANYLHVHTTIGKTMFLYSLTRAAEELQDEGTLVHRSFWVRFDHVQAIRHQGSQTFCHMSDGTAVPVSRRRRKALFDHFGKHFNRATPTA